MTSPCNPEGLCLFAGIPRASISAIPFEIIETPRRVVFSEHQDEVVCGHGDALREAQAMPGAQGRQVVQAADSPFGIAPPQALIEFGIAWGGGDAAFDKRAIQEQAAA